MDANTILKVDKIQKYYGNKESITKAIDNISFEILEGEFVGIMGASGSGKTTLLNCISTVDTVTSGQVFISDQNITELSEDKLSDFRSKQLGFIFQDFNLLDTLTAFENISLALSISKTKWDEIEKKVNEIAKQLNITDVLNKYPYQMSGGQQQRVAAARAMITKPSLVLADEPTGALDSRSAQMLLNLLVDVNNKMNATICMVTHDSFAASYTKRILFLKDGKIHNELIRGNESRREFFDKIMDVVSLLGGALHENI